MITVRNLTKVLIYVFKKNQNEFNMANIGEYIINADMTNAVRALREDYDGISIEKISEAERVENIRIMNNKTYTNKIIIPCTCHIHATNHIEHGIIMYIGEYKAQYMEDIVDIVREELSELDDYLDIKDKYSWDKYNHFG